MTREEAILWMRVLKHSKINWVGEKAEEEDIIKRCEEAEQEAFDMAIEALSQGRREDATEEDYAYCDDCEAVEMCMWYPYDNCIFKVRSRPEGEWIEKGGELVCSVCGNSVSFSRTPKGWVLGKFCQTCGTQMKGGAE